MDQIWFAEKNVTLITTDLKGTDVADIYADFKFSEDGKEIISCPAGHRPKSNVYDINTQKCKASFPILESYGYEMNAPRSGSSHYTFRKQVYANYNTKARTNQESICRNGKADCRKRGEE